MIAKNPLGMIMNMVEAMGLEVTYAYDDLVFVAHNAFLLQMTQTPREVNFYFNQQTDPNMRDTLARKLSDHGQEKGLLLINKGFFTLEAADGNEEFKVIFSSSDQP